MLGMQLVQGFCFRYYFNHLRKQITILPATLVNAMWYASTIRPQYRTVIKKTRDATFQEIAERSGIAILCGFYEVTC